MHVERILKDKGSEVVTVAPDASIAEAIDVLNRRGIGALVVSADGDGVAGILSERDLVRALARQGSGLLDRRVSELMTSEVFTCEPGDTVEALMSHMTERRIRHIPVVDGGRLVGVVSIGDVVKNRLEEMEHEAESLREYITRG